MIGIMFGIMTALFTRFTEEKISYLGNNIAEERLIDYSTGQIRFFILLFIPGFIHSFSLSKN